MAPAPADTANPFTSFASLRCYGRHRKNKQQTEVFRNISIDNVTKLNVSVYKRFPALVHCRRIFEQTKEGGQAGCFDGSAGNYFRLVWSDANLWFSQPKLRGGNEKFNS